MNTNKLLLIIFVVFIISSCTQSDVIDESSPVVMELHFDEGEGVTITDSSTNELSVNVNGDVFWTDGISGSALSFQNGTTDVSVEYSKQYLQNSTFSVEAWINPYTSCPNKTCIIVGDHASWFLSYSKGIVQLCVLYGNYGDCAIIGESGTPLTLDSWHYLAATYNGSKAVLYIDGEVEDTKYESYKISDSQPHRLIFIGSSSFLGIIDEVRITSFELSADEIQSRYNNLN